MIPRMLRYPQMILAYSALGLLAGLVTGVFLYGLLFNAAVTLFHAGGGWQMASSGVSGVGLIIEMSCIGASLGGVSGFGLVAGCSRYRVAVGWALAILGILASIVFLVLGLNIAHSFGVRFALSLAGVAFLWALQISAGGGLLLLESRCRWRQRSNASDSTGSDSKREASRADL